MPIGVLLLIAACAATAPEQPDWIRIGITTKDEVIQRYGSPDLVIVSPEGETATFRPRNPGQSPNVAVPTIQPGGSLGAPTTRMQEINPRAGVGSVGAGTHDRPAQEFRIRYDRQGIVQEIIQ